MKVRSGFVSNSSSSSFIVCGFNEEDSCKVYDMLKDKFKVEGSYISGNYISEREIYWKVDSYLKEHGIDYLYQEECNDMVRIGCILGEGSREKFDESLKKAENTLKKFDEDHHTDFTKNHKIYSVFEEDF